MGTNSFAKIISYNLHNEAICASAARISTTKGNAYDIFEKSNSNKNNRELIQKVLSSGHKSIIEHAVFTIALQNVSAFVEQFFIEYRLASFTVKSRRYVDFSNLGYYIPPDLCGNSLKHYTQYMDMLFSAYQLMLDNGIPKEDARFLLPYSFNSNFYCTMNARELIHVIHTIKYGRGSTIDELQILANQLINQLEVLFPSLIPELHNSHEVINDQSYIEQPQSIPNTITFIEEYSAGNVELIQAPSAPKDILEKAYQIAHPDLPYSLDFKTLLQSKRLRELEQLTYSFLISDISLSGITHIVRHRMQSIIIPPLQSINYNKFIIPDTIRSNPTLLKEYKEILIRAYEMRRVAFEDSNLKKFHYYYALSGNVTNIITTINARELMLFIRLRSCNRAQWEIRKIAIEMLKYSRLNFPQVFNFIGPSCYTSDHCPEGKLTCGKKDEVIAQFNQV